MIRRKVLVIASVAVILMGGVYSLKRWRYPYGYSHCCDKQLWFALEAYARDHGGAFPAGGATPEASLSWLYPQYADAHLLAGKTTSEKAVQQILASGQPLDADSCSWHYVDGLTENDDHRLAIIWDKIGLGHNGERLSKGGHSVIFLGCGFEVIPEADWPKFLQEQQQLLAARERKR